MPDPLHALDLAITKMETERQLNEGYLAASVAEQTRAADEALEILKALDVLRASEESWRENFRQTLEAVVSQGATSVMGRETQIILTTSTFRDVTSVAMSVKQGNLVTPVEGAHGGTLVQVLSVLFEVLMMISVTPPLALTILLDEPFGMVSKHYRPALCQLITELNAKLGIQFIIVSQEDDYLDCAQLAYEVYCEDGPAQARVLKSPTEGAVL